MLNLSTRVRLQNFLDRGNLDVLNADVGIRCPGKRHEKNLFEQVILVVRTHLGTTEYFQNILENLQSPLVTLL